MIEWILFGISVAQGGSGDGVIHEDAVAPIAGPAYVAEPQVSSGKFTTALEVKPILGMTKGSWIAVREYDGQDLLYFTQLLSWRCGLHEIRYGVNGDAMQVWEMPPCLTETASPNAIRTEDGLPYIALPLGSVQSVRVELLYDDLGKDVGEFARGDVLMP